MPETKGLATFQILEKLKLTDGKKLKRAAIIMFSKEPMRFYPNIQVKIGRFGKDASDLKFHEVVEGNLVQMLHEVQIQLNYKFLTRPVAFEGFQRIEKDQYPIQALREMLLNALVHRTYMGATIQMREFDDKLSIWNEGGLPFGLSLEDLKSDLNSRPRNPIIANACYFAGYIDTWGRGTLKIINSCKEAGLPEPEIKEMKGGVEVTVFISEVTESGLADGLVENETGGQTGGVISSVIGGAIGGAINVLTDRQKEVLGLIISNNRITYKEIVEKLSINESAVADHIKALKDKGVIKRSGKTSGQWLILIDIK